MAFFTRRKQQVPPPTDTDVTPNTSGHSMSDTIANIERSVEHFRGVDVPGWRYRQIIRDRQTHADQALTDAQARAAAERSRYVRHH